MDAERFQVLAGAYGGDLARWPEAEQAAARVFMADDRRAARWLSDEVSLDALLSSVSEGHQNDLLRERIIRSAPKPAVATPRKAVWASWAGLAAACAAGIVFGAQLTTTTTSGFDDPDIEATVQASTAFADSALSQAIGEAG